MLCKFQELDLINSESDMISRGRGDANSWLYFFYTFHMGHVYYGLFQTIGMKGHQTQRGLDGR